MALRVSFLRFNGENIIHLSTGYTVSYFSSLFAKFNRLYSPSFLSRNLYEQNQGTVNKNMSFSSTLNKVTKWFRVRQGNRYSIRGGIDGSFLKIINTTLICISCHMQVVIQATQMFNVYKKYFSLASSLLQTYRIAPSHV